MLILEGPDGGGKTTLAHRLADRYDLEYRRPPEALLSSTQGPSNGLHEWWREQMRRPAGERAVGVYDRCFWVSEPIYTAVGNRKPLIDNQLLWRGISDLWAEGPLMIFCMTDEAAMLENTYAAGRPRLASIADDEQKLRNISFLYWAFYGMWLQASNHVIQWDYNYHAFEGIERAYEDYQRVTV